MTDKKNIEDSNDQGIAKKLTDNTRLSIVAPIYNEEEVLPFFFERITHVLDSMASNYEIICVNDGSSDASVAIIKAQAAKDSRIKLVSFSRNFGKEAAMSAAMQYATGDAVIPIDVDLQDPPELISQMIDQWQKGADVVLARRASRQTDTYLKRTTASWFYRLFNKISDTDIPYNVGDYRLMDRKVVDVVKKLPEKDRFMKGLFCWPGFRSEVVEYERPVREQGESKFGFWRLWNFAISGITSFSTIPIRMGTYFGLIISGLSFIYALVIVSKTMLFGVEVPGYASIMVALLFVGGVQLFFLGIMGEYIGRIYKEVKNRPLYIVGELVGLLEEDFEKASSTHKKPITNSTCADVGTQDILESLARLPKAKRKFITDLIEATVAESTQEQDEDLK